MCRSRNSFFSRQIKKAMESDSDKGKNGKKKPRYLTCQAIFLIYFPCGIFSSDYGYGVDHCHLENIIKRKIIWDLAGHGLSSVHWNYLLYYLGNVRQRSRKLGELENLILNSCFFFSFFLFAEGGG